MRADDDEAVGTSEARLNDGTPLLKLMAANEGAAGDRIALLFEGGTHYNSLIVSRAEIPLASGTSTAGGPKEADKSSNPTWSQEGHGRWKKEEGKQPGEERPCEERYGEAVVGNAPKECKRRRIRGKCKGYDVST